MNLCENSLETESRSEILLLAVLFSRRKRKIKSRFMELVLCYLAVWYSASSNFRVRSAYSRRSPWSDWCRNNGRVRWGVSTAPYPMVQAPRAYLCLHGERIRVDLILWFKVPVLNCKVYTTPRIEHATELEEGCHFTHRNRFFPVSILYDLMYSILVDWSASSDGRSVRISGFTPRASLSPCDL